MQFGFGVRLVFGKIFDEVAVALLFLHVSSWLMVHSSWSRGHKTMNLRRYIVPTIKKAMICKYNYKSWLLE